MQLRNAFVGAIIGGAIGIAVLVAAYFLFGTDHTGFAIIVACLVGLGVRALATTNGHASYVRGALTALIAIAAFVGGKFIVVEIATRHIVANTAQPMRAVEPTDQLAANETSEATSESGDEMTRAEVERTPVAGAQRPSPRVNTPYSAGDFIWLCIAALIAYELGRGSGTTAPTASTTGTPLPPAASA